MDMKDRVEMAKRAITFIATSFPETDEAIVGALQELTNFIGEEAAAIPSRKAALAARLKFEADRNASLRAAHAATGAPPLPEIKGEISFKG